MTAFGITMDADEPYSVATERLLRRVVYEALTGPLARTERLEPLGVGLCNGVGLGDDPLLAAFPFTGVLTEDGVTNAAPAAALSW